MTHQMLTDIRVSTKEELEERIYKYFEEINVVQISYKWKHKMDTIDLQQEDISDIIYKVVNAKAASTENKAKRALAPKKRKSKNQEKIIESES